MDKLFGVAIVLVVSLLAVFGIFEIGINQYSYYIEKGLRKETASLFSFMGLVIGIGLTVAFVVQVKLFESKDT